MSSQTRRAVERRSAPALIWLKSKPTALLPVVSVALLLGGLVAPPLLGVVLLLALLAVVGWLTYLSWPVVEGGARVVRVLTLGLLVAAVLSRLA